MLADGSAHLLRICIAWESMKCHVGIPFFIAEDFFVQVEMFFLGDLQVNPA